LVASIKLVSFGNLSLPHEQVDFVLGLLAYQLDLLELHLALALLPGDSLVDGFRAHCAHDLHVS